MKDFKKINLLSIYLENQKINVDGIAKNNPKNEGNIIKIIGAKK